MSNPNPSPETRFQKGAGKDPRINRKGRPKNFDSLRALAQQIANEQARSKPKQDAEGNIIPGEPIIIDGHLATVAEMVMRSWANSKDPRFQIAFIEYAYGKVPVKQENLNVDLQLLTDEQLKRLQDGEDIAHVLKRSST